MGTDIHGFVECRTWTHGLDIGESAWCAAISLSMLGVHRDYDAFDCLFGVRSSGDWRPIAADRGLPQDASETARAELAQWGEAAFGVTWSGWEEVTAIDWDEPALHPTNVAQYRVNPLKPWRWSYATAALIRAVDACLFSIIWCSNVTGGCPSLALCLRLTL
ncbi:hypothetical protein, partial [Nonomuraea sp. NPDC048916]|uniref:hypothetical protein n=1 Tax=Nonomuraea sp. NPDC048916 TaxID=3154232 RepID=UPI0033D11B20